MSVDDRSVRPVDRAAAAVEHWFATQSSRGDLFVCDVDVTAPDAGIIIGKNDPIAIGR